MSSGQVFRVCLSWTVLLVSACAVGPSVSNPAETEPRAAQAVVVETRLYGTLVGSDERALGSSTIELTRPGREPVEVAVDGEGNYELRVEGPGLAKLEFGAVDHTARELEMFLMGGDHALDVRLGTDARPSGYTGDEGELRFATPDSEFARFVRLLMTLEEWSARSMQTYRNRIAATPGAGAAAHRDTKQALLTKLEAELPHHQGLRRAALIMTMLAETANEEAFTVDDTLVDELLALVAPEDSLWSLHALALSQALVQRDRPEYFAQAVAEQRDDEVVAQVLFYALAQAGKAADHDRARTLAAALKTERFAGQRYAKLSGTWSSDHPLARGKTIPDFRLTGIDGERVYTAAGLRGQAYVLDFWSLSCGPCMASMPVLHQAWATLNGHEMEPEAESSLASYRGLSTQTLEFISVAFEDGENARVQNYRDEQWPMPWAHVVVDEDSEDELRTMFGVVGIPVVVLVGTDGTILESGPAFEAEDLEARARMLTPTLPLSVTTKFSVIWPSRSAAFTPA